MSTTLESASPVEPEGAPNLVEILRLEQVEPTTFRSSSRPGDSTRLFGGEVAAQAVVAAAATVGSDRHLHSVHCYFLLPGDSAVPVVYLVREERDGGAFSNRSVAAYQHGHVIFTMTASFQAARPGVSHQTPTLRAPDPESVPAPAVTFADDPMTSEWIAGLTGRIPVDLRFPESLRGKRGHPGEGSGDRAWIRASQTLPDDAVLQSAAVVYLSDLLLLTTVLRLHDVEVADPGVQLATVDHSVWFHAPCRADEWFMYEVESDWSGQGRALSRGRIFDRDGRLCASTMQEGAIRVP